MAKVSVIVPIYNAEKYLEECLESLLNQSLADIEIICIDDKSTDRSMDILEAYQKKDNRLKVICNDRNSGASMARNKGLSIAQGKYIQFVDADDYLELTALEELYLAAEGQTADMCYLGMKFIVNKDVNMLTLQYSIKGEYQGVFQGEELIKILTEKDEFFLYLWSVFYRNSFINANKLRYKSLKIGEGGDFILRALCHAERVIVCTDKYYNYRVHQESITHCENAKKELLYGQIIQYIDVLQFLSQHDNEEAVGLQMFLERQHKKIAGGIKLLSSDEKEKIEYQLKSPFSKCVYRLLQQNDMRYGIEFDEELLSHIFKKKYVIIYGAGYATKEIVELLQEHNVEIVGFAVTKRSSEQTCVYGHHIYEIQELSEYKYTACVLIAANKKYNKEIQETLDRYDFQDYIFLNVEI